MARLLALVATRIEVRWETAAATKVSSQHQCVHSGTAFWDHNWLTRLFLWQGTLDQASWQDWQYIFHPLDLEYILHDWFWKDACARLLAWNLAFDQVTLWSAASMKNRHFLRLVKSQKPKHHYISRATTALRLPRCRCRRHSLGSRCWCWCWCWCLCWRLRWCSLPILAATISAMFTS